ncbi:ABC transporter permease [Neoactinobaculum massilliense]|uniref:ABC transporter permease n=1 Tax=Neoactinobaculum massilliense TaxID=2364794 RepID=UPI0019CFC71E|nr:ABC transporter permease [Neoactinobaculum massilliense]
MSNVPQTVPEDHSPGTALETPARREEKLARTHSRSWRIMASNVGWAIVAVFIASLVIFFALHILPGDPASILGGTDATPEQIQRIRVKNGWDRPIIIQYLAWLGGVLTGNFGSSPFSGHSVTAELAQKLQITLPLALMALVMAVILALLVGVFAAAHSRSVWGHVVSWLSQLGIAVPTFVLGLALVVLVAIPSGGAIPATGFPRTGWADPGAALLSLLLPAITLAIPMGAGLTRFVRSAVLEQISQDHMRTALAQGTSWHRAVWAQALRNAWLPIIAVAALDAAGLLMGTVVVEQVFALPGVGQSIVAAVSNRDIVTVQGFLMVLSTAIIVIMLLANLLARLLDPRVRIQS